MKDDKGKGVPVGNKAANTPQEQEPAGRRREFRQPHMDTPAQVEEEKFEMVPLAEAPPKGLVENIKARVSKVVKKVQRLIKPEVRTNKEIIINAESLETRVAVCLQLRINRAVLCPGWKTDQVVRGRLSGVLQGHRT